MSIPTVLFLCSTNAYTPMQAKLRMAFYSFRKSFPKLKNKKGFFFSWDSQRPSFWLHFKDKKSLTGWRTCSGTLDFLLEKNMPNLHWKNISWALIKPEVYKVKRCIRWKGEFFKELLDAWKIFWVNIFATLKFSSCRNYHTNWNISSRICPLSKPCLK